jgi:hypothetical protein
MTTKSRSRLTCAFISSVAWILALSVDTQAEPKKYDTPKQPWSDYTVHQIDRPNPEKVKTNGAVCTKPPAGAVVLFDGKNTDAFTRAWRVKDGLMIASPGSTQTKKSFGSCKLHVEWRVPAGRKVDGQYGANSGVFLMSRYEVQVLESFENVTYADGQAAAIYGQYPPSVNASVPQGEWHSYDIIFEAPVYGDNGLEKPAFMTVIHNGVKVHDRQQLHGPTTFKKLATYPSKHPDKAPIRIQWHKDPIEFRNIWVQDKE